MTQLSHTTNEVWAVVAPIEPPKEECAICRANITLPVSLACQAEHAFCRRCITTWLKQNSRCPLCRDAVLPLLASEPTDKEDDHDDEHDEESEAIQALEDHNATDFRV